MRPGGLRYILLMFLLPFNITMKRFHQSLCILLVEALGEEQRTVRLSSL